MNKSSTEYVRSTFVDYFKKNDHKHVPTSSLIPQNDPSLMFVNSGMVQFKNIFTGKEKAGFNKAVTSQKALRAGGKHNDIDQVGRTARHHTFFEMLGNFSFGDYFKEEAIFYAWDLITKEYQLAPDKLCVTVYHEDEEAVKLWRKISGLNDDKIIRIKTADNFWSMGDLGPCGPCSEIFYDHGPNIAGGPPGSPDEDGDRFVEIWNLVFMQYEQITKDKRIDLPNKSIDTGMGLERIAAILQGVHNNFEIDIFQQLITQTSEILNVDSSSQAAIIPLRVIADHIRSTSFLIADGIMPSNDGRGYVLRRIMRRAMRFINQLGTEKPAMYKLVAKMVDIFGHVYPEIARGEEYITGVIEQEEERFLQTLKKGMKLLDKETKILSKGDTLSGQIAFKMYDTYGFPLDLTENILESKGININHNGFDAEMQKQKEQARKAWVGSGQINVDNTYFDLLDQHGPTEFVGYITERSSAKILAIICEDENLDSFDNTQKTFLMLTNQTPFYGESGGQMGDIGKAVGSSAKVKIVDTHKALGKLHVHVCQLIEGGVKLGDEMDMEIDTTYRRNLKIHHSATHILHSVLREILGTHVTQKGSLVASNRLRFDFSHPSAVSPQQLEQIEKQVNTIITNNSMVKTEIMSSQEAIEGGAMALFGEKYDDEVRVVSMGAEITGERPHSFELCGGTHVNRCGDIGAFKISSESAIAGGVRRIEAVCGNFAFDYIQQKEELLRQMEYLFKCPATDLPNKANHLLSQKKQLESEIAKLKEKAISLSGLELKNSLVEIQGISLLCRILSDVDLKIIRKHCEQLVGNNKDLALLYIVENDGHFIIITGSGSQLQQKLPANILAKAVADFAGGKGGGSVKIAQVGGQIDANKAKMISKNLSKMIENSLAL